MIGHAFLYTNVYLEELIPIGQHTHWAGGSGFSDLAAEQRKNGSLCKYTESYSYLYGLDNSWDYSDIGCERASMDSLAFKSPTAMHFVTYESKRHTVLVARNGSSDCTAECRLVRPEWPSAASYGEKRWQGAYVPTVDDIRLRTIHPDTRKANNVKFKKPTVRGKDRCECYSLQNVFFLGVDAFELFITHAYSSRLQSGTSKEKGEDDPMSFVVAEDDRMTKPFRIFEKGERVLLSLDETLKALGTCLDCQPSEVFYPNSLCKDETCEEPYKLKPVPRITGARIDLRTEFYSHKLTTPKEKGPAFEYIVDNYEPPYAIHVLKLVEDWTSMGASVTTLVDTPEWKEDMDRYKYGVLINLVPADGIISALDVGVIINNLCNFTVLLGFPQVIMGVIIFYLLGRRSLLLRRGQRRVITLKEMYRGFAYQAIVAEKAYQALDPDNTGFITVQALKAMFQRILHAELRSRFPGKDEEWYDQHLTNFVEMMINKFQEDDDPTSPSEGRSPSKRVLRGISHKEFIRHCTSSASLDWDDVMDKLANPNIDLDPVNMLFSMFGKQQEQSSPKAA
eukprot:gnl/TRDRNA2_/TRDRNA2_77418_c0_seq1.p1 gnl/TRDRNA2_/TRDRNA2_77418_c0~~gnl/TRDRNA2_/TRDRNA2_77418_c0_seq1.p1  ORF type:complete len:565 (-),score=109.55 gnl/TRDRNA2_/TRDRNA2_77418_c0_seq1:63-1757(-)